METEPQGLAIEDIRRYLHRICEEAEEMMRAFDPQQVIEWAETNIANDAPFHVDARMQRNGAYIGSASLLLMKEDILKAGGMFGAMANKETIADYSLEFRLHDVTLHGSDAATAQVTWNEHIAFRAPTPEGVSESRYSITSVADCHHLLIREEGVLMLGMSLCSADVSLSTSE